MNKTFSLYVVKNIFFVAILCGIDFITKAWVTQYLDGIHTIGLPPHAVLFYQHNSFYFGLFLLRHYADNMLYLIPFIVVPIIFSTSYYGIISNWIAVVMSAGIFGNMGEIAFHGYATDFISFEVARNFLCMNLSDLMSHISRICFIFQMFSGVFYAKKFSRLQGKKLTTMETLAFMRNRRAGKIQASWPSSANKL